MTAYKRVKGPRNRIEYRAFLIGKYILFVHTFSFKIRYTETRVSSFQDWSVAERGVRTPTSQESTPGSLTGSPGLKSTLEEIDAIMSSGALKLNIENF